MSAAVPDVPTSPRGLAGVLMGVASRLDEADTPPSFQRTQTMLLIALCVNTFYPMLPL
jgi:hypothetical protein